MTASPAFELFLKKISTARAEADALISAHPQSLEGLSDATVIMLWHALYDTLLRGGEEENLLKLGTLIEKMYASITERKLATARLQKEASQASTDKSKPSDASTISTLEQKLKLL